MKLLLDTVEALFLTLPADHKLAFWDTMLKTSYDSGVPLTRYIIRVTAILTVAQHPTLAEVTIPCGAHSGEPHDQIDKTRKEGVTQYKRSRQNEITRLAHQHGVQLRAGILTEDPQEKLYGSIAEEEASDNTSLGASTEIEEELK